MSDCSIYLYSSRLNTAIDPELGLFWYSCANVSGSISLNFCSSLNGLCWGQSACSFPSESFVSAEYHSTCQLMWSFTLFSEIFCNNESICNIVPVIITLPPRLLHGKSAWVNHFANLARRSLLLTCSSSSRSSIYIKSGRPFSLAPRIFWPAPLALTLIPVLVWNSVSAHLSLFLKNPNTSINASLSVSWSRTHLKFWAAISSLAPTIIM